ncbi:hypothetical protein C8R46DRAFT_1227475 [Mycena filopes]|nr:hypothetical protein C8R46DRAFT_1227475 [Mycena filopes]
MPRRKPNAGEKPSHDTQINIKRLYARLRERECNCEVRRRRAEALVAEQMATKVRAQVSAAAYREKNKAKIRATDAARRARLKAKAKGTPTAQKPATPPSQKPATPPSQKHTTPPSSPQERPSTPTPTPSRKRPVPVERNKSAGTSSNAPAVQGFTRAPRRYRFYRADGEVLSKNQRRCRELRGCRLEEINSDDSDADVPPGMCGCARTECQRMHRNETQVRRDWKVFHLKHGNDI